MVTKNQNLKHISDGYYMHEWYAQKETLCAQCRVDISVQRTFNKLLVSPEAAFYLFLGFVDNLKVGVDISDGIFRLQRATGEKRSGVSDVDFYRQDIKKLVMDVSAMHNIKFYVEKQLEILHWFVFFMEVPRVEIDGWPLNKDCAHSILNLAKGGLRVRESWVSGVFPKPRAYSI